MTTSVCSGASCTAVTALDNDHSSCSNAGAPSTRCSNVTWAEIDTALRLLGIVSWNHSEVRCTVSSACVTFGVQLSRNWPEPQITRQSSYCLTPSQCQQTYQLSFSLACSHQFIWITTIPVSQHWPDRQPHQFYFFTQKRVKNIPHCIFVSSNFYDFLFCSRCNTILLCWTFKLDSASCKCQVMQQSREIHKCKHSTRQS